MEQPVLRIKMERERLLDEVDLDTYIGVQEGDLKALREMVATFVVDEKGEYLEKAEGLKLVGKLKIRQLKDLQRSLVEGGEQAIVPPENGAV